jgi:large subunit ribosomal protein L24
MLKLKINDKVVILSGKDRGKVGIISKVFFSKKKKRMFSIVEGINLAKKHARAVPNKNKAGGIISVEKPIDCSNISLFCQSTGKKEKVCFKFLDNGIKSRVFKFNKGVVN